MDRKGCSVLGSRQVSARIQCFKYCVSGYQWGSACYRCVVLGHLCSARQYLMNYYVMGPEGGI